MNGTTPVEIPTEYMCSDLAFVPAPDNNPDHQFLYVANRWRHSVLKYEAYVVRDASNNPINVVQPDNQNPSPANKPITGDPRRRQQPVPPGAVRSAEHPLRREQQGRPGRAHRRSPPTPWRRRAHVTIGAPSADVVNIDNLLFVPTTMPARGLLTNEGAARPGSRSRWRGCARDRHRPRRPAACGQPGRALRRHQQLQLRGRPQRPAAARLLAQPELARTTSTTRTTSPRRPTSRRNRRCSQGSLATAVARNTAGTIIWLADSGSDSSRSSRSTSAPCPPRSRRRGEHSRRSTVRSRSPSCPTSGSQGTLLVADGGSELVELIDVASGTTIATADTGYADIGAATYPASNVEIGELNFYSAAWSNNGRKACASCHFDELDTDGVGFSQGAIAPTTLAQVKPNHNLGTTNSYFWNGSFSNGNYTSLAFAFQTRDNCQIVEFGFVEGAASDPTTRVGDPNNLFNGVNAGQDDTQCRPCRRHAPRLGGQRGADRGGRPGRAEVRPGADPVRHRPAVRGARAGHRRLLGVRAAACRPTRFTRNTWRARVRPKQLDSQTMSDIQAGATLFTGAAGAPRATWPTTPTRARIPSRTT